MPFTTQTSPATASGRKKRRGAQGHGPFSTCRTIKGIACVRAHRAARVSSRPRRRSGRGGRRGGAHRPSCGESSHTWNRGMPRVSQTRSQTAACGHAAYKKRPQSPSVVGPVPPTGRVFKQALRRSPVRNNAPASGRREGLLWRSSESEPKGSQLTMSSRRADFRAARAQVEVVAGRAWPGAGCFSLSRDDGVWHGFAESGPRMATSNCASRQNNQ